MTPETQEDNYVYTLHVVLTGHFYIFISVYYFSNTLGQSISITILHCTVHSIIIHIQSFLFVKYGKNKLLCISHFPVFSM